MKYTLKELLNIPRLRELLESFDEIQSMPSAIIDNEGNVLIANAWQDICTKFHRKNPETEKLCIKSDIHVSSSLADKEPYVVYCCPLGLVDSAMPIIIEGNHLGNVFTGQLFMVPPDETRFIEQARRYGFDEPEYIAAMRKVPYFSEEHLYRNLNFIHKLTLLLAEQGVQYKREHEAQEALRASEQKLLLEREKYQIVSDYTHDWEFWVNQEGNFIYNSPSCKTITGYDADRFVKDSDLYSRIIHPDDQEIFYQHRNSAKAQIEGEIDFRIIDANGDVRWIAHTCLPVLDEHGNFLGTRGSNRDITLRKRVETELRESENRLEMAQEVAMAGVWDWDVQTGQIQWSVQMFKLFGLDPNLYCAGLDAWKSVLHPEDREIASSRVDQALGQNTLLNSDYRIILNNGQVRWINSVGKGYYDDKGLPQRMIGICVDITERKRAEVVLKKELERGLTLLDIYKNAPCLSEKELYEYVLDRIVGLTDSEIGFFHIVADNQNEVVLTTWNSTALKGCTAVYDACYPIEQAGNWVDSIRQKHPVIYNDFPNSPNQKGLPDGHTPITRFMSIPVMEGEKVRYIFGVGNKPDEYVESDVVQIQLVANELQKIIVQRRFAQALGIKNLVFDASIAANSIVNPDGFIVESNRSFLKMWGYTNKDEVIGKPLPHFFVDPEEAEFIVLSLDESDAWEGDFKARRADGSNFIGYAQATTIRDERGTLLGYQSAVMDITEHRALEFQLQQSQKMESVGRLAGGVAHDFNNMLGVILGHAEMAMLEMDPADPVYKDLEQISKAGRKSADLTRQLLAFARKQTVAPKVLDLNEAVTGMHKILCRLIGEGVTLNCKPGSDLWRVRIDPSQIDQILANLCVNARDAIADIGVITIETGNCILDSYYCITHPEALPGEYVRLSVTDNGCGMDRETLSNIFEPFFTTKGVGEGTGLGLSTVYGIVKQNNGFINVYSEPGSGTVFTLYFHRYSGEEADNRAYEGEQPLLQGQETILLVEDELAFLLLVKRMLEELGYTVIPANSPFEAIRLASSHVGGIAMLMSDVVMPEMHGKDLAKNLKAIDPKIRQLFMSGYTSDLISCHGILEEGVNFIQKPFLLPDLAAKVREVLDGK